MSTKVIYNSYIAKQLLKMGNEIIDIKPDKNNHKKTLFVFNKTNKLLNDLATLNVDLK